MEMELQEAGWQTARITPYNDTEWIETVWIESVEEILGDIPESVKAWPFATLKRAEEVEQELARRIRELEEGTVQTTPAEEVHRRVEERIRQIESQRNPDS